MRRNARSLFTAVVVSLSLAACGGGGGGDDGDDADDAPPPDAFVPPVICGTAAHTMTSYPGNFSGTTVGAGADLGVAEMACADERAWFGSDGDDQVINLLNLTPGATYVVDLVTMDDLSFYVAEMCDATGPTAGACLLHVDVAFQDETGEFVAPASGQVALIIDAFENPAPPATGMYTVTVREAECTDSSMRTAPGAMVCDNFACVECAFVFDCTDGAAPICDETGTCVAGPMQCTGDDANEDDDGPAAATMIAAPTVATPTVTTAAVCNTPDGLELDWFSVTVADGGFKAQLDFDAAAADLDLFVVDSAGGLVGSSAGIDNPEIVIANLTAGTYYIVVDSYDAVDQVAAAAYTLTLSIPECVTSFECLTAAAPVCDTANGVCVAGSANCTGDDAADGTPGGDDGPAGSTLVTGATQTFNRQACEDDEGDWYRMVMVAGQGLTVEVDFTNGEDFDVYAMNANGEFVGFTFWLDPETVTLTYLPTGPVYIQIVRFAPAGTAASPYTAVFTRTTSTPALCASAADCAAEYETQIYRGQCTAGACVFLPPGTAADGAACDSSDDCASGLCSYSLFVSDAQDSVCTTECVQTADCAAVGAGLTCTTGFSTNICHPSCDVDTACGARTGDSNVDPGLPWNYFTCTVATGVCSP